MPKTAAFLALATPLIAPLLIAATPPAAGSGAPIEVAVHGVGAAKGFVHVDVCTQETFLKTCRYTADVPAVAGTTIVTIANVPPGRYGASAYWDANGNHKADRNFLGMPLELVGFSNDAPVHMAPPSFADAAFDHAAAKQRISFTLRHLP